MKLFRSQKQDVAPVEPQSLIPVYKAEVSRLEGKLTALLAETEALADVRHMEWKVRKVQERKTYLEHGVTIPETTHDKELGRMFEEMERRMREEERLAQERLNEVLQVEKTQESELQRSQAQKALACSITEALNADFD